MLVVLQDCLLSMFLYVFVAKIIIHLNDKDKGVEVYRQETQK